jgi:hypothetical protein
MSVSHQALQDDQQLVRYLLGLLSERETERLDAASIEEDEVASRLVTVENDLVDAYVSGTLEPEIRERFEALYLATPLRRENVAFARRFLVAVDRAALRARSKAPAHGGPAPRTWAGFIQSGDWSDLNGIQKTNEPRQVPVLRRR